MSTGFFGKLPVAGDFVARGIPAGVRRPLDSWLTTHIAGLAGAALNWPAGGVRAVLALDGKTWLLVIEPGEDSVGRPYPLAACVPLNGADRAAADRWADAAAVVLVAALDARADAVAVQAALARIQLPDVAPNPLVPPLVWWNRSPEGPPQERLARLALISSG